MHSSKHRRPFSSETDNSKTPSKKQQQQDPQKCSDKDQTIAIFVFSLVIIGLCIMIFFLVWNVLHLKCFFVDPAQFSGLNEDDLVHVADPECLPDELNEARDLAVLREKKKWSGIQMSANSRRSRYQQQLKEQLEKQQLWDTLVKFSNTNRWSVMPLRRHSIYQTVKALAESGEYQNSSSSASHQVGSKKGKINNNKGTDVLPHNRLQTITTRKKNSALSKIEVAVSKKNLIRASEYHDELLGIRDAKVNFDEPMNKRLYCELTLLHSGHCQDHESAAECIFRVGAKKLELALPIRCSKNSWFQNNFIKMMNKNDNDNKNVPKDLELDPEVTALRRLRQSHGEREIEAALDEKTNLVISGGKLPDSQMQPRPDHEDSSPYIPKHKRTYAKMPPPENWLNKNCVNCSKVYRLPMSIPEEAIVDKVYKDKLFDWNPMMPVFFPTFMAKKSSYSYGRHDEVIIREILGRSYFAWTHRRGCWSAQRHLDILAAGSVPFFPDLLMCKNPDVCLPGYPVHLVKKALKLAGVKWMITPDFRPDRRFNLTSEARRFHIREFPAAHFIKWPVPYNHAVYNPLRPGIIKHKYFNLTEYFFIAEELLEFTKKHLTSKAIAAHFLKSMDAEDARVVFGTSYWWLPHTVGLIHGLVALGLEVYTNTETGFLRVAYNSTEEVRAARRFRYFFAGYRGAGHLYGVRTDPKKFHDCGGKEGEQKCLKLAKRNKFDLYFYCVSGDLNGAPMYHEYVKDNVEPGKVAFIDGLDQADTFCRNTPKIDFTQLCRRGHKLFTREPFVEREFVPTDDLSQREFQKYRFDPSKDTVDLEGMYW